MVKDFEQRLSVLLKEFDKHELVAVEEGEKVQSYYMMKQGTRVMSALLTFTPEGITIQGDVVPEHNGSASCHGYGLNWFAKQLDPFYLCSKFLQHKWTKEVAVEQLNYDAEQCEEEVTKRAIKELAAEVEFDDADGRMIYDRYCDLGMETADGIPGWDYDPQEAVVLVAIQRKFAELWAKRKKKYYVLCLNHPDRTCTWWRANNAGYCGRLDWAGKYEEADALTDYHNDGVENVAVPCDIADKYAMRVCDNSVINEILNAVRNLPNTPGTKP